MKIIRTLSQSMVNKIAAGEVIERPASVVKELVENSIDAGSTRIDISVEQGGTDLIRIVDNGEGIAADQLVLAVSPHSTSKITDTGDLFKILTFGFRGEALASVAEISQMSLKSRTAASNEGAELKIGGGQQSSIIPAGLPVGTQIEVHNLFFNTPVRRKYLKSTATEFGHITEAFFRLALPQPAVHFTLMHNGKTVYDLPSNKAGASSNGSLLDRIRQLFGEEIVKHLIYVESREGNPVRVHGFVSHPNISRSNNRMQYFFLNNRFIRDKSLQHALGEAYRSILTVGRFPSAFLLVDLPPDMFDVNVHPAKMEVRWLDSNRIYSGFLSTIREKFLSTDLNGTAAATGNEVNENTIPYSPFLDDNSTDPRFAIDENAVENTKRTVLDWLGQADEQKEPSGQETQFPAVSEKTDSHSSGLSLHTLPNREPLATPFHGRTVGLNAVIPPEQPPEANLPPTVCRQPAQFHSRYIVIETENGIGIIDQHALHERILYEKLKVRIDAGQLDCQRLLVPFPVDLSPNEFACVSDNTEFFKTLGLTIEPFGGGTVLISAVPSILSEVPPEDILLSMIDPLLTAGKKQNQSELLKELLHSMACKAAVKAGEHLHPDSVQKLIELAKKEQNAHHCPHGRPSMLVFTIEELDKMFKRT